jgi:hypothetical protein
MPFTTHFTPLRREQKALIKVPHRVHTRSPSFHEILQIAFKGNESVAKDWEMCSTFNGGETIVASGTVNIFSPPPLS